MINAILQGIITLIISLVNLILAPIDNLILNALPDLSNALSSIGNFFTIAGRNIGWAISLSGLSSNAISLIIIYYAFKLTAPMLFYMIKLAIAWYNKIKP